jgi:hypothetical protein
MVAYLFASNAGGFGLTGTDNVISCGSYTGTGALLDINLGYEPQWIMVKRSSAAGDNWVIIDNMRGFPAYSTIGGATLNPNLSDAEDAGGSERFGPTATGFQVWGNGTINNASGSTYIYIAIRRGPMKVPTSGTSVFGLSARTGTGASASISNLSFPPDLEFAKVRTAGPPVLFDKLRGSTAMLQSSSTAAESTQTDEITSFNQTGVSFGASTFGYTNLSGEPYINWLFRRAPSFFDEVCYTGNSTSGLVVNHNLASVPELVIFKKRAGSTGGWPVWTTSVGTGTSFNYLNTTSAVSNQGVQIFTTTPTSTAMTLGSWTGVNDSNTMVAYLFATCAGVSKVFSYTGNGSSQTINCGFTGGARFVLIKRTDSTGDWYVWDTARGIVAGNDPHLSLNSTAAEVTSNDTIDTDSTGFVVNQVSATNVNVSSATYIGLAIA